MDRTHDQEGPKAAQPLIFGLDIPAITHLIDAYKNRTFAEDLEIIRNMEDADGILRLLHVNADTGLQSNSNLEARAMHFGDNKRAERKNTSFLMLCWDALGDFTMRLLLVIGTFQLFLGIFYSKHPEHEWMEGFAILIAVVVVVLVTAVNDYQKQKKFSQLQESYKNRQGVRVLRDGNYQMMNPQDILVGDILMIENGLIIPADGVLLTANSMMVDEAAMTGENDQIQKSSIQESMKLWENYLLENPKFDPKHLHGDYHHTLTSPIILSGTTLSAGSGRMVVLAVGPNSAEGRILTLSTQEESETPLQRKLNKIARDISKVGLACGILAIVILFTRFFIELGIGTISWDTQDHVKELTDYILIGITILVVAIPEGLPLAVAISLAYSVKKMQKDNNLVKKMHACETMGGADMICSDKTGTLTTNNMTVANFMLERTIHDFETTKPSSSTFPHEYFAILKETICVNSSASVTDSGEDGSKTEIAMLKMLKAMGHDDYEQVRRIYESRFHRIFPFSSERKRSSIVISLDEESTRRRVHVKGASEIVFDLCTSILNERGQAQNLESSQKEMLLEMILGMNRRGLRTICLAYANLDPRFDIESVDASDFPMVELQPLTCIGIVGIKDPVREGVPQAVRNCKRAHIRVRMITGDNEITARAIAEECQIIVHGQSDQNCVITGKAFNDLVGGTVCKNCRTEKCGCTRDPKEVTDQVKFRVDVVGNMEKFKEIIGRIDVMARSRPEDKYTMVTGLNELGHVVAVTGDGTNDAPALRKADIGFAMGIQGTMLARETADIVLLDDNFASIVVAVKWGRNIYDNIRRFIQFQLTVNVVAVSCAIIGGVTIKQSPLTPVQMMWVNLIMDTFASLALATDEPREELLDRFPQKRTESIVSKLMWKHIYGQAFLQTLIVCVMMFAGEYFLPEFSDGERALKSYDNEDLIRQGRDYHLDGEIDYKDDYDDPDIGPSRHFTYIFNVFVFMQLFNEFNARRIQDEVNVFQGITKNWLFIGIWLFTALTQVLMVSVGGYAFSCHIDGLTVGQWFISIGIAILCLPWRLVLLLIPSKIFMEYGNEELDLHTQSAGALIVRRSTNSINRRNSITPL